MGPPPPVLVAMEATGHYWKNLLAALTAAGHDVALLNPFAARRFQDASLGRTKTDAIDAEGLARLAFEKRPAPAQLHDEAAGHPTCLDASAFLRRAKGWAWSIRGNDNIHIPERWTRNHLPRRKRPRPPPGGGRPGRGQPRVALRSMLPATIRRKRPKMRRSRRASVACASRTPQPVVPSETARIAAKARRLTAPTV